MFSAVIYLLYIMLIFYATQHLFFRLFVHCQVTEQYSNISFHYTQCDKKVISYRDVHFKITPPEDHELENEKHLKYVSF